MIVARKVVENKKSQKQNLKKSIDKNKICTIAQISFLTFLMLLNIFFICINNFKLIKPNFMPHIYIFIALLILNAISILSFSFYNKNEQNFNLKFSLVFNELLLSLLLLFMFVFANKHLILVFGLLLALASICFQIEINANKTKNVSPYIFAHLINLFLSILSIFIFLVN